MSKHDFEESDLTDTHRNSDLIDTHRNSDLTDTHRKQHNEDKGPFFLTPLPVP